MNSFCFGKQHRIVVCNFDGNCSNATTYEKHPPKMCKYCVYFNFVFACFIYLHLSLFCCYLVVFIVSSVLYIASSTYVFYMFILYTTSWLHRIESHGSEQILLFTTVSQASSLPSFVAVAAIIIIIIYDIRTSTDWKLYYCIQ